MRQSVHALRPVPITRSNGRRRRDPQPPIDLSTRPEPTGQLFFQDPAFRGALRAAVAVVLVLATLYLIYLTRVVVQSLFVAAVLATMLWPWVTKATKLSIGSWHLPRALAVALIYAAAIGFTLGGIWLAVGAFLPVIDSLVARLPQQTAFIGDFLEPFRRGDIAGGAAQVVEGVANGEAGQPEAAAAPGGVEVGSLILTMLGGLLNTALVLIFAFFLLLEGNRFAQWIFLLLPRERRPAARDLGLRIRDRASRWVLGTVLYSSLSAAILTVGFAVIGIPNPWIFGVLGAVFALIPGLGVGLVAIPAAAIALGQSTWQAIAVVVFGVLLHIADATYIAPKIFGNMLRLPMFVVFVAILIGAELLGFWGAILALPIAAGIQLALQDAMGRPAEEPVK